MLSEKHDSKMSKHKQGHKHIYDESGRCFECDKRIPKPKRPRHEADKNKEV